MRRLINTLDLRWHIVNILSLLCLIEILCCISHSQVFSKMEFSDRLWNTWSELSAKPSIVNWKARWQNLFISSRRQFRVEVGVSKCLHLDVWNDVNFSTNSKFSQLNSTQSGSTKPLVERGNEVFPAITVHYATQST